MVLASTEARVYVSLADGSKRRRAYHASPSCGLVSDEVHFAVTLSDAEYAGLAECDRCTGTEPLMEPPVTPDRRVDPGSGACSRCMGFVHIDGTCLNCGADFS